jgi:peptide/nickel transport system permease protein
MAAETPFRRLLRQYCENPIAVVGAVILVIVISLAALSPWIAPQNPYDISQLDILESRLPPGSLSSSEGVYWLGTDDQGRDILSAILYGLRTSLLVGAISAGLALVLGTVLGIAAAFFGGIIETIVVALVDIQLSFPAILIALILIAMLGPGVDKVILALVAVQWAFYARTIRASALVERRKEYIEAARCLCLPTSSLLFRHLMPNCLPPLIIVASVQIARAIGLEATLSFLGLGLPITKPSLGLLIANGFTYLMSGKYWISVFPGMALVIAIVAINLVGDQLRDVLNPRNQK